MLELKVKNLRSGKKSKKNNRIKMQVIADSKVDTVPEIDKEQINLEAELTILFERLLKQVNSLLHSFRTSGCYT